METPVDQLKASMEKLDAQGKELAAVKLSIVEKETAITTATAERDAFKVKADEAVAKVAALEIEKAAIAKESQDFKARAETAEAKLKSPEMLAAAGGERKPVEGMASGGGESEDKDAKLKALEAKLRDETNPIERAKIRAAINSIK